MRGKVLCYGAIIRSCQAGPEELGNILESLVTLATKRSYLAAPAYKFIVEALSQVTRGHFFNGG
jgi:hypothetical protein